MLLEHKLDHKASARALLISQYQSKPVIEALLDAFVGVFQELEDVLWQIVDSRILDAATGAQLDLLGRIVNEIRRGRSDADYRVGIRIKVIVLRSKGRTIDVISVAALSNAPNIPRYHDDRYLNFHVEAYGQTGERYLVDFLAATRAAASYGCLVTSDLEQGSLLTFGDVIAAGEETFSDAISGGLVAAACYGLPTDLRGVVYDYTDAPTGSLLLETGDALLLETGDALLLG